MSSSSSSLSSKPTKSLVNSKVNLFQQHAAAAAAASADANRKSKETRLTEINFSPNKISISNHLNQSFQFFEKKQTFTKLILTVPPTPTSSSSSPSINRKYSNANADSASAATLTSKLNTASNVDLSSGNCLSVGDLLNTTTSKSLPLITTTTTTTNTPETSINKNKQLYSSSSVSTSSLDVNNTNTNTNGEEECKRILVINVRPRHFCFHSFSKSF